MNLFILKIIGIVTMFLDHYQFILGGSGVLRIIGRIAFPIFAFSLSEGYVHTRSLRTYLTRLFIFAVNIQILFMFFGYGEFVMNIFFTLFSGLLAIYTFHLKKLRLKEPFVWIIKFAIIAAILFLAEKSRMDYGAYGVLLIMIFNIFRNKKIHILVSFLLLNIIFTKMNLIFSIQNYSLASLIFIFMYNGQKGRSMKYFFYLFYPVHFAFLEMLKYFLENMRK